MSERERNRQQPKDAPKQPPVEKEPQENPPEDDQAEEKPPEEEEAPPEPDTPKESDYKPIEAEDDKDNPVFVKLPKTDEEVAEEGTKLSQAESIQTGGVVAFAEPAKTKNKRLWNLDGPHNTNDRQSGGPGWHRPDYVEHTG